jgi:hypothetical protein
MTKVNKYTKLPTKFASSEGNKKNRRPEIRSKATQSREAGRKKEGVKRRQEVKLRSSGQRNEARKDLRKSARSAGNKKKKLNLLE